MSLSLNFVRMVYAGKSMSHRRYNRIMSTSVLDHYGEYFEPAWLKHRRAKDKDFFDRATVLDIAKAFKEESDKTIAKLSKRKDAPRRVIQSPEAYQSTSLLSLQSYRSPRRSVPSNRGRLVF